MVTTSQNPNAKRYRLKWNGKTIQKNKSNQFERMSRIAKNDYYFHYTQWLLCSSGFFSFSIPMCFGCFNSTVVFSNVFYSKLVPQKVEEKEEEEVKRTNISSLEFTLCQHIRYLTAYEKKKRKKAFEDSHRNEKQYNRLFSQCTTYVFIVRGTCIIFIPKSSTEYKLNVS